ncbi:Sulfotransferase family protein [Cognatiyoonia koreensis]|uniref:Sulfotransferase family protein n=2 Tax=Cognatiyoonia koreensis TaxID=364200 RepID=A0A1I0RT03_9RHOB|nr:Sulfotransferase family protein [Cognatiyoonia koreensis]
MFRLMLGAHPELVEIGENQFIVDGLIDPHAEDFRYNTHWLRHERVFRMRNLTCPDGLDGLALRDHMIAAMKDGRDGPPVITFHADIDVLDRLFPTARYIHIYRDPRDVANSATRFGWSGNVYYGADFWLAAEESWARKKKTLNPRRYAEVRYEDLVMNPSSELSRLCDFLGIAFTDAMFGYAEKSTYDKPDPKLTQQWKRKLTSRQTALVEHRCGPLMDELGYERAHRDLQPMGRLSKLHLAVDNKLRKVKAAIRFFGFRDYGMEKIFRLPGLQARRQAVLLRMQETMNRSLK